MGKGDCRPTGFYSSLLKRQVSGGKRVAKDVTWSHPPKTGLRICWEQGRLDWDKAPTCLLTLSHLCKEVLCWNTVKPKVL